MKWIKEYIRIKKIDERALNSKTKGYIKIGDKRIISNIELYKKALDELIGYTIESGDFKKMIEEVKDPEQVRLIMFLNDLKNIIENE